MSSPTLRRLQSAHIIARSAARDLQHALAGTAPPADELFARLYRAQAEVREALASMVDECHAQSRACCSHPGLADRPRIYLP